MQGSITIVDANVEERVVLTPGTIDNGGIESDTRKDFDIVITSIRIPYGYVSRGSLIEMSITIENTGRRSLRDIDMSAILLSNNAQGFVAPFDLRPGEQVSKRLYVMLPSHTRLGNDYVLFTIGNEDRQRVLYRGVTIR
jgi:hypothetical protein